MTAPWPAQGYPSAPGPALVPQQGTGLRVLRLVLVALLVSGWFWDAVSGGSTTTTSSGFTVRWDGSGLAGLATLVLLIAGPQPRWATKWAWFWLLGLGPMAAVFLLVEPVPVWQSAPAYARPSRLTGGWAFLLAIFSGLILSVLTSLLVTPWLAVLRSTWGVPMPSLWFLP